MATPEGRKRLNKSDRYSQLEYALNTEGAPAADKLMRKWGWNGSTSPYGKEDYLLIYDACHNNGESLKYIKLYDYLTAYDPDCVFSKSNGGNMLHAWAFYGHHISVLADLLERGVDPLEKNSAGKTPLEVYRSAQNSRYSHQFPSPTSHPALRDIEDQIVEDLFEKAIAVKQGTPETGPGSKALAQSRHREGKTI